MTIEVEKEDGTQKGPKIEVDLPTFDTQSDALLSLSKRAQRARQQIALLERDIEFEIGRLAHQLDAEAAVLRRLEHQILPLQRKRLALRQREESYMLIDVFELAEVKLTLLEQLHEMLDATERYWLDQANLSHQRGLLLRETDALVWQQFLPGVATGSQAVEKGHDRHQARGMDHSGHDMSGSSHQMEHDGHGTDHSGHVMSNDNHEMDRSGHDMPRSSEHMEHEVHSKDHAGHKMTQVMDQADSNVGDVHFGHRSAASGVEEEHSSQQHNDSHEQALKLKHQAKKKASTVDGAASGH